MQSALRLLERRARRDDGTMRWLVVQHERCALRCDADSDARTVGAVVARSGPGLRTALRDANVEFGASCMCHRSRSSRCGVSYIRIFSFIN